MIHKKFMETLLCLRHCTICWGLSVIQKQLLPCPSHNSQMQVREDREDTLGLWLHTKGISSSWGWSNNGSRIGTRRLAVMRKADYMLGIFLHNNYFFMIKDDLFCSLELLIEDIGNVLYLCYIQISNNLDFYSNLWTIISSMFFRYRNNDV